MQGLNQLGDLWFIILEGAIEDKADSLACVCSKKKLSLNIVFIHGLHLVFEVAVLFLSCRDITVSRHCVFFSNRGIMEPNVIVDSLSVPQVLDRFLHSTFFYRFTLLFLFDSLDSQSLSETL